MELTFQDWINREVCTIHVHFNRENLIAETSKVLGRNPTLEEIENLEVQLEIEVTEYLPDELLITKDWIEDSIVNDVCSAE